jgi:hypothetical protein
VSSVRAPVYPHAERYAFSWTITLGIFFALAVIVMAGCTIAPAYVEADRATYDAIVPRYTRYLVSDPNLSEAKKNRFLRTVESWRARLAEEEGK